MSSAPEDVKAVENAENVVTAETGNVSAEATKGNAAAGKPQKVKQQKGGQEGGAKGRGNPAKTTGRDESKDDRGITISKNENFAGWFSQVRSQHRYFTSHSYSKKILNHSLHTYQPTMLDSICACFIIYLTSIFTMVLCLYHCRSSCVVR